MESRSDIRKEGKKEYVVVAKAVGINLAALLLVFAFFEPGASVDDLWPANILYGACTGEYIPTLLYSNDLLALLMVALLKAFPNVAWYYVLFYAGMWLSFVALTYIFLKKCSGTHFWICFLLLTLPAYHDFFVRLNFGKTAALLTAAGFALIFYAIASSKKKICCYLFGTVLILFGSMIRYSMLLMVIMVFFGGFLSLCIRGIRQKNPALKKQILSFAVTLAALYAVAWVLQFYSTTHLENQGFLKDFQEINAARASVQDYAKPPYKQYREQYEKLGISENDFQIYWGETFMTYDPDKFTTEMLEAVRDFSPISKYQGEDVTETVVNITRNLLRVSFASPQMVAFVVTLCLLLLSPKTKTLEVLLSGSMSVVAVLYLLWKGRTTPDVLTAVFFTGGLVALLLSGEWLSPPKKRTIPIYIFAAVGMLFADYENLSASGYYGETYYTGSEVETENRYWEDAKTIEEYVSLMNEDREHVYLVFEILGRQKWLAYYDIFEAQQPGSRDNIIMMYDWGLQKTQLEKFGIQNPWSEITDNNTIYWALYGSDKDQIEKITTYIQENYAPDAKASLAKQVGELSIYRFYTDSDAIADYLDGYTVKEKKEELVTDLHVSRKQDTCHILGTAYVKGQDSFAQTVVVEVVDENSKESAFAYLEQSQNKTCKTQDKKDGKYAACQGEVDISGMSQNISVYVYVQVNGSLYKEKVQ